MLFCKHTYDRKGFTYENTAENVFIIEIRRKRSIYKTATLTSHLVGNNSEILPKFGNFV